MSTPMYSMLTETDKINYTIASVPENICEVDFIMEQVRQNWGLTDETAANIELCLTEAINNAILHGNKSEASKKVKVEISRRNHNLICKVEDEGTGFDYNALPDPTLPENIEKPTGRGVFLIKQLAGMLIFSKNGSLIEMEFPLA